MRICVSGAAGVGKSTFIDDFLKNWPSYKTSGETYRELIEEKGLSLNKKGTQESQNIILNALLDEAMKYKADDNVIHDRGTIDNLVYSLWLKAKDNQAIDDNFIQKTFQLVKESMFFYDIIFYIPYNDQFMTEEQKDTREKDPVYNKEIDNFFKSINERYFEKDEYLFPFNTDEGVPALIEIFGDRRERIELAKLYVTPEGGCFSEDESLIADVLSSEEIKKLSE